MPDREKRTVCQTSSNGVVQNREVAAVNEPGLYTLVIGSRKPEAKFFKRWITHEVIPAIRKHGAYMTDSVLQQVMENPEAIYTLAEQLLAEKGKNREISRQLKMPERTVVMATDSAFSTPKPWITCTTTIPKARLARASMVL